MEYNALGHAVWDTLLDGGFRVPAVAKKRIYLVTMGNGYFRLALKRWSLRAIPWWFVKSRLGEMPI